jgi:5-methylcytosine-specific restriction protein A
VALSRPKLCIDCGTITINGTRCRDCELSNEAIRRLKRGKTSDRYGAEYQRNRKILLEHAKAEGVSCALAIEGVCQGRPTTADHKIPISRGGTHDLDNLQPACGPCNSSKRDRLRKIL